MNKMKNYIKISNNIFDIENENINNSENKKELKKKRFFIFLYNF